MEHWALEIYNKPWHEACQSPNLLTEVKGKPAVESYDDTGETNYLFERDGVDICVEDGQVSTIFMYVTPYEDYEAYQGSLPLGMKRDMRCKAVMALLGQPDKKGYKTGGKGDPNEPEYLNYWRGDANVCIEFLGPDGAISNVSICKPYRSTNAG